MMFKRCFKPEIKRVYSENIFRPAALLSLVTKDLHFRSSEKIIIDK